MYCICTYKYIYIYIYIYLGFDGFMYPPVSNIAMNKSKYVSMFPLKHIETMLKRHLLRGFQSQWRDRLLSSCMASSTDNVATNRILSVCDGKSRSMCFMLFFPSWLFRWYLNYWLMVNVGFPIVELLPNPTGVVLVDSSPAVSRFVHLSSMIFHDPFRYDSQSSYWNI